jgi:hypothetical protein
MPSVKPVTESELEDELQDGGSHLRIEVGEDLLRRINIEAAKRVISNRALIIKAFLFLIKNEEVKD